MSGHPTPETPVLDPARIVSAVLALLALLPAVVWPHMAGSVLRLLLVVLALVWIAGRAYRAELPDRDQLADWSPFDGFSEPRAHTVPDDLLALERAVRNADDPARARRTLVPEAIRALLVREAERPDRDLEPPEIPETLALSHLDDLLDRLERP